MLSLALAAAFSAHGLNAQILPVGGVAVHGQAVFSSPSAQQLVVATQNGPGTGHSAINWQSFSISAGSSARINQPSAASLSINRVVTNNPSAIFGNLSSNGRLVLVNPSGITVGAGAVVDTAGFTASALRMSDADALSGRLRFGDAVTPMGGAAGLTVEGRITARDGDIILVAPQLTVGSSALLQASNGSTILAAGQQVEITGRGLEGITMLVQARDNEARNLGRLEGDAVGVFAGTLRHSGEIQATTASFDGGRVVLQAAGDAFVEGSAKITATGRRGGQVDVLGERVVLTGQALVDVSGSEGGGSIRIGGDFQGKNLDVPNARRTYLGPDVGLRADATGDGNGGRVIVWSDDQTHGYGSISARGGAQGGDGGFVEVSGKHGLAFDATVDTRAAKGRTGTLLLDPDNIDIQATGPATLTDVDQFIDGSSASLVIAASTINAAAANVVLQANNDITFSAPIAMTNDGVGITAQAGFYITVAAGATITTRGGAVSLLAGDLGSLTSPNESAVFLNAAIDTTNGGTVSGGANVTIKSRLQDLGTSSIDLNANINAGTVGVVILDSFGGPSEGGSIRQFGGTITALNLSAAALQDINLGQSNLITGDVSLGSNLGAGSAGFIQFTNSASSFNVNGVAAKGNVTITTSGAITTDGAIQSTTGNVAINTVGDQSYGHDLIAAGTLSLSSSGGQMTQGAGTSVSVGGLATINGGSNNVLFDSNQNDFNTVNVTGAHITLVDANALTISALSQLANRNLYLQTLTGLLTVPSAAISTGVAQLSLISAGGAFTTPGILTGSDILLVGGASLALAHNVTATGNMTLFSSGDMTQSAGTTVSSNGNMNVTASGTLTVQGGAASPTALVSVGNQTITATDIQVIGGAGGANASAAIRMTGGAATQNITASNGISITGGASGGGLGIGNYATIASNGNQVIAAGNGGLIMLAGGGTGLETGNSSNLEHNGGAGTSQSITITGGGSIILTAGSAALTGVGDANGNRASIRSDNGDSQTINMVGASASISMTGGTLGSDAYAEIYAGTGTQLITGADTISLFGGASGGGVSDALGTHGNLAVIGAETNHQTISANTIQLLGGSGGINNAAAIVSGGNQSITVGSGGLGITGGSGGSGERKNAAFILKTNDLAATSQIITIGGGASVLLQGGSSSDSSVGFDSNLFGLSNGSFAMIRSDGISQLIEFTAAGGSLFLSGGTAGSNNFANILATNGSQTIRGVSPTQAPNINMLGGTSGGVANEGNRALIGADVGNQNISASGINLNGGSGGIENVAQIRQGNVSSGLGATQLVTLENIGNLSLTGGAGTTNLARLQAYGLTQTVNFTSGGSLTLTGGTGASNNFARLQAVNGNQTISGAPNITLNGGASGGADLAGNFSDIRANAATATQSITATNFQMQAGATGQENYATIVAQNQIISVLGDMSLTGGGSATSLDGSSGGGSRIGGLGGAAPGPTNLSLTVANNLSLNGGTVAGSALGASTLGGQATTITLVVAGDLSLNPGSGLGSGARIGSPSGNLGAGDINITAGADFSLSGGTAGETVVRTLGAVNINAATALVGNSIIGGTVRLQASSGVSINTSSGEAGSITATAGSGDTLKVDAGTSFFNGTGSGALNVAAGGRWLVFSSDPSLDTRGGLIYDFKQYGTAFGGTVLGIGNGFLYTLAPTVTAVLSGSIVRIYDGTDTASVAPVNLSVAGALVGDVISVSGPSAGTFDTRHVGVGKTVTLNSGAISVSALDGGAPVYGYTVAGAAITGAIGQITPASLVVTTNPVSKVYDGLTNAGGVPVATSGTTLFPGDTLSGGSYAYVSRDVGLGNKTVTVSGVSVNDGNFGNNYTVGFVDNTSSSITALAAATWTGSFDTAWTNPANWAGGVVPVLTNVQSVSIPAGAGTVVFDASAGTTSLQSLTSARPISVTGGNLQIDTLLQTASYSQSGTSILSGTGSLNVTDSFTQTGGSINMGAININQATGNLNVGNLSAPVIALSAPGGTITQSGSLTGGGMLTTASQSGSFLTSSGNQVGAFSATNAGSGDIFFVNTGTLAIQSLTNAGGSIDVVNTGGVTTSGAIRAPAGNVSITANSPLTIGAGGIEAGGDIVLNATNLTSAGDLTLNGVLTAGNMVNLTAGNAMVQNFAVFGANGVTAAAGTSMLYGPLATANNPPVSYSVAGISVAPPPSMLASALQAPGDLLVTFLDLFQQAISGDLGGLLELDDDGNLRRRIVDGLVSEEELCR